ncbi:MAG: ABC transporter permease [Saprospiraceae bacterium]|nr:ABC transporter permease [Saprospiraceae bacterium]
MLQHYFKSAVRSLFKNKRFALVNMLGLAIGMGACLMLLEYVSFERSFDGFHENADRIYRVVNHRFKNGEPVQLGTITYPRVGYQMHEDFPEIEQATRIAPGFGMHVHKGDQDMVLIDDPIFVDNNFFQVLSYPLLIGDPATALQEVYSLVISESRAKQLFGEDVQLSSLIDQPIHFNNQQLIIKGICKDLPANTILQYDFFVSYATFIQFNPDADNSWTWSDFYHFIQLAPGTDVAGLEAKFADFSKRHFNGEEVSGSEEHFYLQPIKDAHLNSSDLEYEIGTTANGNSVSTMLLIAFFILILAWINYVNLATVRAIERSREVGVRKIVGARRAQLMGQFLSEALLMNLIAFLLATQLAELARHRLVPYLGIELPNSFLWGGEGALLFIGVILTVLLLGVLVTGSYPAFVLSGFKMTNIIKGKFQQAGSGRILRRGLIVFQFAASIALMAGTMLVYRQITFMNQQDLGVAIDQTLVLDRPSVAQYDSNFIHRINAFKGELAKIPGVTKAASSSRVPGMMTGRIFDVRPSGPNRDQGYSTSFMDIDFAYTDLYELEPISGRKLRLSDHDFNGGLVKNILINEAAVELFGFESPEKALNEQLSFGTSRKSWDIVGVLPNFHQRSLQYKIEPLIFMPFYSPNHFISVKMENADAAIVLAAAKELYQDFFPGNAFNSFFLDDAFQRNYESEVVFSRILLFFTLLAILVACLGLFSLVSYTTFLRSKEIGIRKVLGASVGSIVGLLSQDFLKLIGLAVLLAIPVAWYVLRLWLRDFAYQTAIPWWMFGVVGLLAMCVGVLTVGGQSLKAALANPVKAIKQEG